MSGRLIHFCRNCINGCVTWISNSAIGDYIWYALESQRQGSLNYSGAVRIRENATYRATTKTGTRLHRPITGSTSYLSDFSPDNERQHPDDSGEHKSPTSHGGHHGFRYTVTGENPDEITEEVKIKTEQGLDTAKKTREKLEAVRAARLDWLINERNRLYGHDR